MSLERVIIWKNYYVAVSSVANQKKILIITEGPRDELHLIRSICADLGLFASDVNFYSYKTDLHNFARIMLPNGEKRPDDTIDILLELKSRENDVSEREIFGFRLFDKVTCKGETGFIFGRR